MLITAQIPRNVSIVTDSRKTREYLCSPTANCRPIILSDSQARFVNYSLQSDIRYASQGGLAKANGILNPAWALKFALML